MRKVVHVQKQNPLSNLDNIWLGGIPLIQILVTIG